MSNIGPFESMTPEQRARWVDTIANQCIGEGNALSQVDGAEQEHIDELMLDNGYDRCTRCDWWEEAGACSVIDDECVCPDCLTSEERDDEDGA